MRTEVGRPITDGTLSTEKMAIAIAEEARSVEAPSELIAALVTAVDALRAGLRSRYAEAIYHAINNLRDAMNASAPPDIIFCEDESGRWGWWSKEDREKPFSNS